MNKLVFLSFVAGGLMLASSASAQEIYDWPSKEAPVMVHDSGAVYFIGKDKTVWRTYKWKEAKGKNKLGLITTDIDGSGQPNVVGAGRPLFVVDHNTTPQWQEKKGCDQVLVANIIDAKGKEVACVKGSKVSVYSFDGQFVWSASVGRGIDFCNAGDINGDLMADIECKHRGAKTYSRFDGSNGEVLAQSTDANELESTEMNLFDAHNGADILAGKETFDLNGDGTPEESLLADGNAVAVRSRSKKAAMGRIETKSAPVSAIVKDIDGDKKLDIVVITKKDIFISDGAGKKVASFPLKASKYKRQPVARLDSVYTNGFEDDAKAKDAVTALNDKLAKCYSGQVRKNQFAGEGKVLLSAEVNAKGKAKSVTLTHTELPDKKVVKCAENTLKKAKYPKPAGESASVNVHLFYTFRDE